MAATGSPLLAVPDDLLTRVLVGIPRADHGGAAAVCRNFRAVISGPRFPRLRREFGFAERAVVLVETEAYHKDNTELHGLINVHTAGAVASVSVGLKSSVRATESTTDGGARMFVCTARSEGENEVFAVDASRRRWKHFATLPVRHQRAHCMEWHGGLLYVAGGSSTNDYLSSLHAFNEVTGLWETLPSMPHGTFCASSAIIGDQLFVLGGYSHVDGHMGNFSSILQIYDIPNRTWRMGASGHGEYAPLHVVDGKLFQHEFHAAGSFLWMYDPQSDTWTDFLGPPRRGGCLCSCVHNGSIVVFYPDDEAWERDTDGTWCPYDAPEASIPEAIYDFNTNTLVAFGSVLLG